jgi:hypothetical protein
MRFSGLKFSTIISKCKGMNLRIQPPEYYGDSSKIKELFEQGRYEEITSSASQDEDVKLLLSLTGIDVYTALLIKSETSGGFLTTRNLYHGQVWHHHYINHEA